MNFENHVAFWLIPASVCFILTLGIWGWRAKRGIAQLFRADLRRLKRKHLKKHAAAVLLMALLAGALASPRFPFSALPAPGKTGEVALLVDVSASMAARKTLDSPSSLDRVKPILNEIVDHLQELGGVRIGLFCFTSLARSQVPFVGREDYSYLKASIDRVLEVHSAPGSGSGFGRPLLDVAAKFSNGSKTKLVVLLSDGEAFVGVSRGMQGTERGLMEEAITRAKLDGIKVVTVGVGEPAGARIPLFNTEGAFKGEYAKLHGADLYFFLRGEGLKEIASRTGGRYYSENDRRGLIGFIERNLDAAPRTEITGQRTEYRSVAHWFVLACLPIWAIVARWFLLR